MMSIEDERSNDHTDHKIGLGVTSKEGDQNGDGRCADHRSKGDESPLPHYSHKDENFNEDRKRRDGEIHAYGGRHPLSSFKPQKDREDMAQERTESRYSNPLIR